MLLICDTFLRFPWTNYIDQKSGYLFLAILTDKSLPGTP